MINMYVIIYIVCMYIYIMYKYIYIFDYIRNIRIHIISFIMLNWVELQKQDRGIAFKHKAVVKCKWSNWYVSHSQSTGRISLDLHRIPSPHHMSGFGSRKPALSLGPCTCDKDQMQQVFKSLWWILTCRMFGKYRLPPAACLAREVQMWGSHHRDGVWVALAARAKPL